MPELPEVETVRRGLNQLLRGQLITGGDVLLARTIAHPLSVDAFLSGLQGTVISHWHRRGKYLFAELTKPHPFDLVPQPGGWLAVHLRMTGQLLWLDAATPLPKHTRVRLFCLENRELRFVDQRTFGQLWFVAPEERLEDAVPGLRRLGPEPFAADFSVEYLAQQLRSRRQPLKSALLDQTLVAGIGNIYADEVLFLSGIHPEARCTDLDLEQIQRLHAAVIQVLQTGIAQGGTTFSNFVNLQGVNGNYSGVAWVYKRDGQPCRVCATLVQRLKLAGRSTHFCPLCQA